MTYSPGAAIKEARQLRGVSQRQLSEAAHVTHRAITYWENEQKQPDVESLRKIAGALGVEFVIIAEGVLVRDDPRV